MSSISVAITCCYICNKSNSRSLRRWESKIGCSTCRNHFTSTFDSAYKAITGMQIDNIERDISDENGKVITIFWESINQWWYVMSKRPFDYTKHGRRRYTLHKLLHSRKSPKSLRLHKITQVLVLILGRFTA